VSTCEGKNCGTDNCGNKCGTCTPEYTCSSDGICTCVSKCEGKICGTDNCGVPNGCGTCTVENEQCFPDGTCKLNTFVAVGEGSDTIAWSDDGKIWNKIGADSGFNQRGICVTSNGKVWVAGGEESGVNPKNMVFSTDNGRTWAPVTPPAPVQPGLNINLNVNGVVWNGTNFIAVGSGFSGNTTAVWSEDGQNWNSSSGDYVVSSSGSCVSLSALACNEKICVALSFASQTGINALIIYSDDSGHSWKEGVGATFSHNSVGSFVAVNDYNYWVAISKNSTGTNILISSGGKIWVSPNTIIFNDSTCVLNCVAHDNGSNWVVVGNKGIGYSSDNGSTWKYATKDNSRITDNFFSVVYNGKIWVASGSSFIFYSSNGQYWSNSDTINSNTENHLCWNGTVWISGGLQTPSIRWSEDVTKTWNDTPDTVFKKVSFLGVVHDIACRYKV
jgi:hypothetical protein